MLLYLIRSAISHEEGAEGKGRRSARTIEGRRSAREGGYVRYSEVQYSTTDTEYECGHAFLLICFFKRRVLISTRIAQYFTSRSTSKFEPGKVLSSIKGHVLFRYAVCYYRVQ